MKATRANVFETNSSSSHSLTISAGEIIEPPFDKATLRKGVVSIKRAEYGWEWRRMFRAESKLSYLLTQLLQGEPSPVNDDENWIDELAATRPEVAMLNRVVKEFTGCKLQLLPSEGYIDHDSNGRGLELFQDEAKLKQFLFNRESWVQTGNDNESPPSRLSTDTGNKIDIYADLYAQVPPGYVAVTLAFQQYQDTAPHNKNGARFSFKGKLLPEIYKEGVVTRIVWDETDRHSARYLTQSHAMEVLSSEMWTNSTGKVRVRFTPHLDVSIKPRKQIKLDPTTLLHARTMEVTFMLPPDLAKRVLARRPRPLANTSPARPGKVEKAA